MLIVRLHYIIISFLVIVIVVVVDRFGYHLRTLCRLIYNICIYIYNNNNHLKRLIQYYSASVRVA